MSSLPSVNLSECFPTCIRNQHFTGHTGGVAGLPPQLDGQWSGFLWVWLKEVLGHDRSLGERLATDMHFTEEVQERVNLMKQF